MLSALVDRLTFRSHVLDMNGPSYRLMSTRTKSGNERADSNEEAAGDE